MSKLHSALLYSSLSGYIIKLISLISVVIVARLLTPGEVGIYAIASSLVMVAAELKSIGTGAYLIRQPALDEQTIKSATGLILLMCWGLGLVLFVAAPFLQDMYGIEDLGDLIRLLTFSFLVTPFIGISMAILTREYKFKDIFIIRMGSQGALLFFTVYFLLRDHSYYSLAYASVISACLELALVIKYWPANTPWTPSFKGLGVIAKFGMYVTISNLLRKFSLLLPDLLIGKRGTTTEVAIFSRGVGFLDFLSNTLAQGVRPVALPYLSEKQRLKEHLEEPYLRATMLLGSVVWPVLSVAGIASSAVIILFFGDQWGETIPIASILCIWATVRNIHGLCPPLLVAAGKEKQLLVKEAFLFFAYGVSIWSCYSFGLLAIAWGMAAVSVIDFLYTTILLKVVLGFSPIKLFKQSVPNVILVLVCSAVSYALNTFIGFERVSPIYAISILAPAAAVTWILVVKLLNHDIYREFMEILARRKGSV